MPSQDLVLGIYYLTKSRSDTKGEGRIFADFDEVVLAYEQGEVATHTPIRVRYSGQYIDLTTQYNDQDISHAEVQDVERTLIDTTVGRVIFNRRASGAWSRSSTATSRSGACRTSSATCYLTLRRRA